MKHKYIITGVTGKIGSALAIRIGKGNYVGISRHGGQGNLSIDLSDWKGNLDGDFPDFDTVIHLAAKAHIDNCEKDRPLNKNGGAWRDNVDATANVVEYCRRTKRKLIFLSTECVFDGKKAKYTERDIPNPINWYGATKLEAEKIVESLPGALVLRAVMAYDGNPAHKDIVRYFADELKNRREVHATTDQKVSFTFTGDIIDGILTSSTQDLKGIYHFASKDSPSVYELAVKISKIVGANPRLVIPGTMEEILGRERASLRLKNSVLDSKMFIKSTKLQPLGINGGLRKALKPSREDR